MLTNYVRLSYVQQKNIFFQNILCHLKMFNIEVEGIQWAHPQIFIWEASSLKSPVHGNYSPPLPFHLLSSH